MAIEELRSYLEMDDDVDPVPPVLSPRVKTELSEGLGCDRGNQECSTEAEGNRRGVL